MCEGVSFASEGGQTENVSRRLDWTDQYLWYEPWTRSVSYPLAEWAVHLP